MLDNLDDEEELESDCITFMIAGFHTTGNLITWAIYFLAMYPEYQEKVLSVKLKSRGTMVGGEKVFK